MKQISVLIWIVILIFLTIIVLYQNAIFETLELQAYDQLIQQFPAESKFPQVTVIKITEQDINQLKKYPISDSLFAEILTQLEQYQVRVIGFDMFRNIPVPPGHKNLVKLFSHKKNIIAPMKLGDGQTTKISPPPVLQNSGKYGFVDAVVDRDKIMRRALITLHDRQYTPYFSLALHLALLFLQDQGFNIQSDSNNYLQLGSTSIEPLKPNDGGYVAEDTKGYQFLLDFCQPPQSIPVYTLAQFRAEKVKLDDFKHKAVLIGVDAESVKDHFYLPCSEKLLGHNKLISGVMIHAAIFDQLLRIAIDGQSPLDTVSDWQERLWILVWVILGSFVGWKLHSFIKIIIFWLLSLIAIGGLTVYLFVHGIWLIVVTPILALFISSLAITMYRALKEKQQRTMLMNIFSKHVAPEIAQELWQNKEQFLSDGRPRSQQTVATVMFTDLIDFTSLAENLEPTIFFDWLNEYLASMTPLVAEHNGVVVRFIGDAIFAGFGIPVPRQSNSEICMDAVNAIRCALAMNEKLIQLNTQWKCQGTPIAAMRIGLFTGPVAVGSIGAQDRMEYTIHGDTVNTAARLEAYDKGQFVPDFFNFPCRILIGEKTSEVVGEQFQLESVGYVNLRGKKEKVEVFRVIKEINKH